MFWTRLSHRSISSSATAVMTPISDSQWQGENMEQAGCDGPGSGKASFAKSKWILLAVLGSIWFKMIQQSIYKSKFHEVKKKHACECECETCAKLPPFATNMCVLKPFLWVPGQAPGPTLPGMGWSPDFCWPHRQLTAGTTGRIKSSCHVLCFRVTIMLSYCSCKQASKTLRRGCDVFLTSHVLYWGTNPKALGKHEKPAGHTACPAGSPAPCYTSQQEVVQTFTRPWGSSPCSLRRSMGCTCCWKERFPWWTMIIPNITCKLFIN